MPANLAATSFDGPEPIRYKGSVVKPLFAFRSRIDRAARPPRRCGWLFAAALFGILAGGACGRKIGDSCSTSIDCDPTGATRTCDLSQPGGYCVIEGCDARSCPEDSHCVRFFPELFLSVSCGEDGDCAADELCVPMDGGDSPGVCARRSLERRFCVQSCGGDGDCRGDYQCLATGVNGVLPLTQNPASKPRFCAPRK